MFRVLRNNSCSDRNAAVTSGPCGEQSCGPTGVGLEWHLFKPIRVVSAGNVGGRDGAVEPTGRYSRRFPEEITRVGRSIARR